MTRISLLLAAALLPAIAVAATRMTGPADPISFALQLKVDTNSVQLTLHSGPAGQDSRSTTTVPLTDLAELDVGRLRADAPSPIRFAMIREPGRLDCAGSGAQARASGTCQFAPDMRFADLLASRGMLRPTREQALGLTVIGANRALLDALRLADYPMPTIDEYLGMTAVGVTPRYIADLAYAGYRPREVGILIQFRAVGVTPEYLGAMARTGYAGLPASEIVQLAALKIDSAFIAGFDRLGYRHLPVATLVQLKALGITPEFVRRTRASRTDTPSLAQLVRLKLFGR